MNYSFHEDAEDEFFAAIDFYANCNLLLPVIPF